MDAHNSNSERQAATGNQTECCVTQKIEPIEPMPPKTIPSPTGAIAIATATAFTGLPSVSAPTRSPAVALLDTDTKNSH